MVRKLLATDVERIESAFPCLLGLTILLLQTIFVSKKAVNNEKWKAQKIRLIRGQKINASLSAKHG